MACCKSVAAASSGGQCISISPATEAAFSLPWRAIMRTRAITTRLRIAAERSPSPARASASAGTAGTSIWMSMRSSSGPEILLR